MRFELLEVLEECCLLKRTALMVKRFIHAEPRIESGADEGVLRLKQFAKVDQSGSLEVLGCL